MLSSQVSPAIESPRGDQAAVSGVRSALRRRPAGGLVYTPTHQVGNARLCVVLGGMAPIPALRRW